MSTQTLEIEGRQYVVVPLEEFARLLRAAGRNDKLPSLPAADKNGNRPAAEYIRISLARRIVAARIAAHITQAELARLAGIRHVAVLNRIEKGKVMPSAKTVGKIEKALAKKGQTL